MIAPAAWAQPFVVADVVAGVTSCGVTSCGVTVDGQAKTPVTAANLLCKWDAAGISNGQHTITMTARTVNDSDTPNKDDATYSTTNELTTSGGYTQGGVNLTNADWAVDTTNDVAYGDFTNDPQWTTATFSAYGAKIYNSTRSNKLVGAFWFNGVKSVSNGTFTIQFPAAAYNTAIVRITN